MRRPILRLPGPILTAFKVSFCRTFLLSPNAFALLPRYVCGPRPTSHVCCSAHLLLVYLWFPEDDHDASSELTQRREVPPGLV